MARDDSFEERKRKREEEDQRDREAAAAKKLPGTGIRSGGRAGAASFEGSIEELFSKVEPLIERLNSLYNQFATGVEHRPPIEVRSQLDQLMTRLKNTPKATPAQNFRFSALLASYQTNSDRWEKLLKDVESGKIKRITGPRR